MPDVPVDDAQLRDLARASNASQCLPPSSARSSVGTTRSTYERSCPPSVPRPWSCTPSRTAGFRSRTAGISPDTSPTPGWWNFPAPITPCSSVRRGKPPLGEIEEFVTGTRVAVDHDADAHHVVVHRRGRLHRPGRRHRRPGLAHGARPPRRRRPPINWRGSRATKRSSPVTASSPPSTAPPAPSAAEPRSATPPARSASKSGSASTPVKSNDAAPNSPASPSTSPIASAKPHSPARCSCRGPSSISSQARARPSTTAANTNSKASPPPGDSSPSLPEPTGVRGQTAKPSRAIDTDCPLGARAATGADRTEQRPYRRHPVFPGPLGMGGPSWRHSLAGHGHHHAGGASCRSCAPPGAAETAPLPTVATGGSIADIAPGSSSAMTTLRSGRHREPLAVARGRACEQGTSCGGGTRLRDVFPSVRAFAVKCHTP